MFLIFLRNKKNRHCEVACHLPVVSKQKNCHCEPRCKPGEAIHLPQANVFSDCFVAFAPRNDDRSAIFYCNRRSLFFLVVQFRNKKIVITKFHVIVKLRVVVNKKARHCERSEAIHFFCRTVALKFFHSLLFLIFP